MNLTTDTSTLLVCTLGGSPEPIVAALKRWQPVRVQFIHSPETKDDIEAKVLPMARAEGVELDAGRYDAFLLPDAQDMAGCLERLRQLTQKITDWAARGEAFRVVVDFTGGTKCMSAAVAIRASHWPCVFSYVGGTQRTKDGVGIVVSGAERILHQANPWDALGHQAVEEYQVLFDKHAYTAAADVAIAAIRRVGDPARKRELAALKLLAEGLDYWDRFNHQDSKNRLDDVFKSANDLRAVLGQAKGDRVLAGVQALTAHLSDLVQAAPPSRYHVLDLLANARRRGDEGRFDDAVARLYRAIEATAQVALKEGHGIESTGRVPLERVPVPLRDTWSPRARDGVVMLGLQDAYALLLALGDAIGAAFQAAGLANHTSSPLVARNQSILAHGFERVSEKAFHTLWASACALAAVDETTLPSFPTLSDAGGAS